MAHAQQQILDLLKAELIAGATAAGSRVYLDREDPLQPSELPAILIEEEPEGETAEPETIHGMDQRQLNVLVGGAVTHSTTAAADARALGLQIELVIANSAALRLLAKGGVRRGPSRQVNTGNLDRLLAARQVSWRLTYFVRATAPDVIL